MTFDNLLVEKTNGVAVITINRPRVMNALDATTLRALQQAIGTLEEEGDIGALILTGAGDRAFVAGGDLAAVEQFTPLQARDFARLAQGVLDRIEQCAKPVIAAVNGFAVGGGCELAMVCDLRLAADTARFGQPEVKLGILAGWAGTQRLPRLVGRGRALELLLTGEMIDAAEAWRIGLVNRVVPAADLMPAALELAGRIAALPRQAIRFTRQAVHHGLEMDSSRAAEYEADLFALCFATEDQKSCMRAFLDRRTPRDRK